MNVGFSWEHQYHALDLGVEIERFKKNKKKQQLWSERVGEAKLPLLFAMLTIRHTGTMFMSADFSSKQGSSAFDIKSRHFTDFRLCRRARAASPHVHVQLGGGNGADRRIRRRRLFVCVRAGACMRAICCTPADFCRSPVDSPQQRANLGGTELPIKRTHAHTHTRHTDVSLKSGRVGRTVCARSYCMAQYPGYKHRYLLLVFIICLRCHV